jgi:hypothetical protein
MPDTKKVYLPRQSVKFGRHSYRGENVQIVDQGTRKETPADEDTKRPAKKTAK